MGCKLSKPSPQVRLGNLPPEGLASGHKLPAHPTSTSRQLDRPAGLPHALPVNLRNQPASSSHRRSRAIVPSQHTTASVSLPSDRNLPRESRRYVIFTTVLTALQEGRAALPDTDRDRYRAHSNALDLMTRGDQSVIPIKNDNIETFIYRIAPPGITREQLDWYCPALADLLESAQSSPGTQQQKSAPEQFSPPPLQRSQRLGTVRSRKISS